MLGFFKKIFKVSETIVYIRFKNEKVHLSFFPQGVVLSELPIIALNKKGRTPKVTAVGKAVMELPPENPSVVYAPFEPFIPEESFDLAEKTMMALLQKEGVLKYALLRPRIVIHPDKSTLSEMEEQAYSELGLTMGGRDVVVYVGETLDEAGVKNLLTR